MNIFFITNNPLDASGTLRARNIAQWINTYSTHSAQCFDFRVSRETGFEKYLSIADVIVFHRMSINTKYLVGYCKQHYPKTVLIYDTDDNEFCLPAQYAIYNFITGLTQNLHEIIPVIDGVTTASPYLSSEYRKYGKPTKCIENAFDFNSGLYDFDITDKTYIPTRKKIAFGGGTSHYYDMWDFLNTEAIQDIIQEYPVDFQMCGLLEIPRYEKKVGNGYISSYSAMKLDKYLKDFFLNSSVILAPLQFTHFNDCKSNLKLLEAGIVGTPVIASSTKCYTDYGGKEFVLYSDNTSNGWKTALREILDNFDMHLKQAKRHNEYVRANNNSIKAVSLRIDFYEQLRQYK